MANFQPWKRYVFVLIDELTNTYNLRAPFLDVGSGQGDVSEYFASRGWAGTALDPSPEALTASRQVLARYPRVNVVSGEPQDISGTYETVFLFDVLEHIQDDKNFLMTVRSRVAPSGFLVLTVPTNPKEWRWDDQFYGHCRRYELPALHALLESCGFEIEQSWDCTFPFLWMMRRLYTRFFTPRSATGSSHELTLLSTTQSAWDKHPSLTFLATRVVPWPILFAIQKKFRRTSWGCERLILARPTRDVAQP